MSNWNDRARDEGKKVGSGKMGVKHIEHPYRLHTSRISRAHEGERRQA